MMRARCIHHIAPEKVTVAEATLPPLDSDHVLVQARCSGLSAGTESLVFRGLFPPGGPQDSTIASLQGAFEYPFAYGYALVGEVVEAGRGVDAAWVGQRVLAFHPHQDMAVARLRDVVPIPPHIDTRAALFLPNMESAINFVMDARPTLGERAMVFGLGVVGLLTTGLLAGCSLSLLIAADPIAARRQRSIEFGASPAIDPSDGLQVDALRRELQECTPPGLDLAIELSGHAHALDQAIQCTGFGGRIIVGSWYGRGTQALDLGTHFHRQRIRLISSQVSTIDPRLSGRWTKERRIGLAWDAIAKLRPERLITHTFPLRDCQRAFELAAHPDESVLQVVFEYS
jgi:2-desacetyl-2-hydroxyethyl bacteriochlorophyllide A dehydrogenase